MCHSMLSLVFLVYFVFSTINYLQFTAEAAKRTVNKPQDGTLLNNDDGNL